YREQHDQRHDRRNKQFPSLHGSYLHLRLCSTELHRLNRSAHAGFAPHGIEYSIPPKIWNVKCLSPVRTWRVSIAKRKQTAAVSPKTCALSPNRKLKTPHMRHFSPTSGANRAPKMRDSPQLKFCETIFSGFCQHLA